MSLAGREHARVIALVPWWVPPRVTITRDDVRRFARGLRWRRIEISGGALEELERLREEHKRYRKYSVARLALLIALSKMGLEVGVTMARDPRLERSLSGVEGPDGDWRDYIREHGLVEEVKDVTDDDEYRPWRRFVEKAAELGANGRVILRRPNGESVVITLGLPTVIAPAYEEVKGEELELVRNETNLSDDDLRELLAVAFRVR